MTGFDFTGKSERDILVEVATTTNIIQADIAELKTNIKELFTDRNKLRSDLDRLSTSHNERIAQGAQCSPVVVNTAPVKLATLLRPEHYILLAVGSLIGAGGIVGVVIYVLWRFPKILNGA